MKLWSTLALFAGLSTAASILIPESVDADQVHEPHVVDESSAITTVIVPQDAPADYHIDSVSLNESHDALQKLKRRGASNEPRDTIARRDFFECATSGNPPSASDCQTVINNVFATNQNLVISSGACLLFQFNTCWGFFCSLCQRLGTSTNFIGNELTTAHTLCVAGGAAGTVVGESAPQWQAGFIRANDSKPADASAKPQRGSRTANIDTGELSDAQVTKIRTIVSAAGYISDEITEMIEYSPHAANEGDELQDADDENLSEKLKLKFRELV
ncbi:hypothetical protein F5B22DRAFT_644818 [Xylaria bambusicola]|uniref:uncharacterized protein n=1 Tax=Xylaria bambusicola TaxID=326684 RepID=UPI002007D786|nr:uncharacterized protein F5B22DRAFT_644818 [Xylaria bambusicola]KAI0518514.1 hypothetical protein F5B22DRAFT_644818 [Xylaria bambusicola]